MSQVDPSLAAGVVDRVGPERGAFLLSGEAGHTTTFSGAWFLQAANGLTNTLPGRWALRCQVALVSGAQAQTEKPFLAVDLPTDLSLPTPWYVMAWQVSDGAAAGASLPGLPGLVVGTDDRTVWQTWAQTRRVALSAGTPRWRGWLLAALLQTGELIRLVDEPAIGTVDDLQMRLMDTFSARAARLIPFLVRVAPQGWRQERVTGMLRKWDYHVGDNNKESPFFAVYQLELARAAFADELGDDLFEDYVAQSDLYQAALNQIIQDPDDEWWDDVSTPKRELRGDILKRAYEPALEWIGRNYGDLHMLWEWDIVHGSRLHHPLGDAWPWDQLLSRDLAPDGWADTIHASPGGLPCVGGICQGGDFFRAKAVYGYRQILDANAPSTLWFALLPGQSGHPFHPHYDD
ncbi:MAG: penicillin acylase family protein, partial [Anaerolineae bacterium]